MVHLGVDSRSLSQSETSSISTSSKPKVKCKSKLNGRPPKYPALYDLVAKQSMQRGKSIIENVQFTTLDNGTVMAQINDEMVPVYVAACDKKGKKGTVSVDGIIYGPKNQSRYAREKASAEKRGELETFMQRNKERSAQKRLLLTPEKKEEYSQYRKTRRRADFEALALIDKELAEIKEKERLEKNREYNKKYYDSHVKRERLRRMQRYYKEKAMALQGQGDESSSSRMIHDFDLNESASIGEEDEGMQLTRRSEFSKEVGSSSRDCGQSTTFEDKSEAPNKLSKYLRAIARYEQEGTIDAFRERKKAIQAKYRRGAVEKERLRQEKEEIHSHLPDKFRARKYVTLDAEGGTSIKVPDVTYHQSRMRKMKEQGSLDAYYQQRRENSRKHRLKVAQREVQRDLTREMELEGNVPIVESSASQTQKSGSGIDRETRSFNLNLPACEYEDEDESMTLVRRTINGESSSRENTSSFEMTDSTSQGDAEKKESNYLKRMRRYEQEGRIEAWKQNNKLLQGDHMQKAIEKERFLQSMDELQGQVYHDFRGKKYTTVGEGSNAIRIPEVTYHQARVRHMRSKGTYQEYKEKRKEWSREYRLRLKQKMMQDAIAAHPIETIDVSALNILNSDTARGDASIRDFDLNMPASEGEEDNPS